MHLKALLVAALLGTTSAHPGHDITPELARRKAFLATHRNNIDHCASQHQASGLHARNHQRRTELAKRLMEKNGLSGTFNNLPSEECPRVLADLRYSSADFLYPKVP
jgi:hypothetical protein